MSANPIDAISKRIADSLKNGAIQVGDAAVEASVAYVKNGIKEALAVKSEKSSQDIRSNRSQSSQKVIDIDTEDDEYDVEREGEYDNGEDSPIPIAFNAFDQDGNLECAAATFRLWGIRDSVAEESGEMPHVVASNPTTGIAFIGTLDELQQFCQHNDLDDKWQIYGYQDDGSYDSSEIDSIPVSKKVVKYIASQLIAMDYDHEKMSKEFRANHVAGESSSVARMLVNIPFLGGVPMAHFAVPYAIIYGAEKNGKFDTYIHEFGENAPTMPTMYTVGDGSDLPRSLVIHGGKMVVKNGFICH